MLFFLSIFILYIKASDISSTCINDDFDETLVCPTEFQIVSGEIVILSSNSDLKHGSEGAVGISSDGKFAIKMATSDEGLSGLCNERRMLKYLNSKQISGIPHMYEIAIDSQKCASHLLVTDNVGPYDLHSLWGTRVSRSTLYLLAAKILTVIQNIHDTGIVHGDIHCENVMFKSLADPSASVTIIDFGQSKLSSFLPYLWEDVAKGLGIVYDVLREIGETDPIFEALQKASFGSRREPIPYSSWIERLEQEASIINLSDNAPSQLTI